MRGTAGQSKRLDKLEKPGKPGANPGGVLVMPPILPLDEWEALAIPQQQALANATRAGVSDDKEGAK